MTPLIWIIDEEMPDYNLEHELLKAAFQDCEIVHSGDDFHKDLGRYADKADAIITYIGNHFDENIMAKLPNCKVISVYGGGYDCVDLNAARKHEITVTFVPGYCIEDISDYVLAAIYYFCKRLSYYDDALSKKQWGAQAIGVVEPRRVKDCSLLIVGFGRIGRSVAQKALALGIKVSAYDVNIDSDTMTSLGVKKVELDEGLAIADFVTVHAILSDNTEKLIGESQLAKMKNSAYLINAARGKIVDEAALVHATNNGVIAGAALDVLTVEPPTFSEEIFNCKNILITPHVSYYSTESFIEVKRRAVENIIKVLKSESGADIAK